MKIGDGRRVAGIGLALLVVAGCGDGFGGDGADYEAWNVEEAEQGLEACAPAAVDRESEFNVDVVEREWDGDRLLRRVDVVESMGEEYRYETEWSYDEEGRIQGSTTTVDGQLVGESVWSYDGDRPGKVERSLHGVVVERQIWKYDGNRLVERDVEVVPRGVDDSLDGSVYSDARYTIEHHDTYAVRLYDRYNASFGGPKSLWEDANAHRQAGETDDCYDLPASPGHGYPDDEASYHLGLNTKYAETPSHLVYDYGYGGFNPQEWYGHVGVATSWPFDLTHPHIRSFRSTMEYDEAGWMVAEKLSYHTREGEPVEVERARDVNNRGLESDSVVVEVDEDKAHSEIRFARDVEGNLLVRERFHRGEVVSHQSWEYEDGTAQRVEIYTSFIFPAGYVPNSGPEILVADKEERSLEHVATHER